MTPASTQFDRRVEAVQPFHLSPAVIFAADARRGLEVDFLERVLADVADPEVAGRAVEAEAPRIAQTVRPDLAARAGALGERIRRRNGVRRAVIDVDAQDLAEELIEVLGVVVRIAAGAAVAGADVEIAVGSELQLPAVVVRENRMRNRQQDRARRGIGAVGIGCDTL